ncbi:MAG: SpaH/EbpB family LPXTG-anchored major pilin [Lachnospiraceae bacterium]|nr:SpaH/EbpB family LPXTG-anchored major pilin [Lachnospiraceae bacterium]
MKKNLKRFFALLLAVITVMAMSVTVFAANNNTTGGKTNVAIGENAPTTGKLTINNQTKGASYSVYKVFSASVETGETTYTWTPEETFKNTLAGKTAEAIAAMDASELKTLASTLANVSDKGNDVSSSLDNLPLGYYLVVESNTTGLEQSQPILVAVPQVQKVKVGDGEKDQWVYDITVTPKSSTTDFDKKIVEGDQLVDVNTKNIGDYVDYRLIADIPVYSDASYETPNSNNLKFEITDQMSNALTWGTNSKIEVYVFNDRSTANSKTDLSSETALIQNNNYTTDPTSMSETTKQFTVKFTSNFLKTNKGKVVVVAFSAQLNENAKIGDTAGDDLSSFLGDDKHWKDTDYNKKGNPNAAKLTYTNEFDVNGESGTDEIDDIVTTFTFDMKVKKIDAEKDKDDKEITLKGAEFTVYTNAACTEQYTNTWKVNEQAQTFDGVLTTGDDGTVTANGFNAGTYYIKETKAPDGYKRYDGVIKVEIVAGTDSPSGKLNGSFTYTINLGSYDETSEKWVAASDNTELTNQTIVTVKDEKGLTLPGTGGIGTTIFTFGGLALVILAAVLFIVYVRRQKKQA